MNSPLVVLDNTWHHVGFTYDGSSSGAGVRIYVDGEDATGDIPADSLSGSMTNTAQMTLGARDNGRNHRFTGAVSEASIWGAALTPENVRYLYTQGVPIPPAIMLGSPRFTPPSTFSFGWSSVMGKTYQVEVSGDLKNWTALTSAYPTGGATGSMTEYTNAAASQGAHYYRVRPTP